MDRLKTYRKKRDFGSSPEPKGEKSDKHTKLSFVVQKHDASHLHYDFRLENRGVLKSWAVPKGPSLNHMDKRLAVEVEDHPLEYQNFEGVIPEGHYGAGKVLIWDKGTYELSKDSSFSSSYKKGHLPITLYGKKLKGRFLLQRIKEAEKNLWLLIKEIDEFEDKKTDITKKVRSVVSNKTLKEIIGGTANESFH